MAQKQIQFYSIHSGKTSTGTGSKEVYTGDFRHCVVTVATSGSATGTLKVYGASSVTPPDFTAGASATNVYTTVQVINLNNGAPTDGNVGVAYTGTDGVYNFEVNINALTWIAVDITAYTQGAFTVTAQLTNNV